MKGDPKVIAQMQILLANELSAIDQYFVHSRIYEDMGLNKLFTRIEHESLEEREHAEILIERMLFLESVPDLSQREGLNVCSTVPEMLQSDLDLEISVRKQLQEAIAVCEEVKDFQSRQHLLKLLSDTEEDHIYWLEKQLRLIKTIGLENYLQSQMGEEEAHA
jgi:bacterioferritin